MRPLHKRVTERWSHFYRILNDPSLKYSDDYFREAFDTYSWGGHLVDEHGVTVLVEFILTWPTLFLFLRIQALEV